jgi:hypothetical protein
MDLFSNLPALSWRHVGCGPQPNILKSRI